MSGAIAMGTSKITGLGDPTANQDASTKNYTDTQDATKLNLSGGTMSGAIAMGTNKITGTGDPTSAQDVATKNYIDTLFGSTTAAASSASAAATSETNAASSATASASSATASANSATAAAASYDQFDDRYLGAKSSAPTVDNDGDALVIGALFFDSSSNSMKVYSSGGWVAAGSSVNGTSQRYDYVVGTNSGSYTDASTTTFPATYDAGFVDIYLNGVKLVVGTDVTASSGTNVVLASPAATGDNICIIGYGTFNLASFSVGEANDVDLTGNANNAILAFDTTDSRFEPTLTPTLTSLTTTGNVSVGGNLDVTGSFDMSDANITNIGSIALDTITDDGGTITLDSSGDIILDTGGDDILFKVGGTDFGSITYNNSNLLLKSSVSDGDIIFTGNDGGSPVTALTLDMSAAGKAIFNSGATFNGNVDITGQPTFNVTDQSIKVVNSANAAHGLEIYRGSDGAKGASFGWGNGSANLEIKNFRNDGQATGPYANIDFHTGGTDADSPDYNPTRRMRIQQTGEVGISQDDPTAQLHIGSPEATPGGTAGSVDRLNIQPYSNTGGPYTFKARTVSGSEDYLDLYYGSNHQVSFGLDGNIGFSGQTAPNTAIHVGNGTKTDTRVQITHENVGGFGALDIDSYGSATLRLISNFSGSTMNGVATGKFGLMSVHNRDLVFGTNGTERFRISGGKTGIAFNSDTAQANHLDDYEEGTFSYDIAGITATTKTFGGIYTKIGDTVSIQGLVNISGKTGGSGNPYLPLPFVPDSTNIGTSNLGAIPQKNTMSSSIVYFGLYGNSAQLYGNNVSGGYIGNGSWGNGLVGLNFTYKVG